MNLEKKPILASFIMSSHVSRRLVQREWWQVHGRPPVAVEM